MLIVKKINTQPYNYNVIFCFNDDETDVESVEKILSKNRISTDNIEKWIDDAKGWTFDNGCMSIVLLNLFTLESQNDLLVTLRHEIHHASANCFEFICNDITVLDEEVFLYLNDWLFEQGLKLIDKHNIKITKKEKEEHGNKSKKR